MLCGEPVIILTKCLYSVTIPTHVIRTACSTVVFGFEPVVVATTTTVPEGQALAHVTVVIPSLEVATTRSVIAGEAADSC